MNSDDDVRQKTGSTHGMSDDSDDERLVAEIRSELNNDATVDVYVHGETSVDDPLGHLTDEQTDGDSTGIVSGALS